MISNYCYVAVIWFIFWLVLLFYSILCCRRQGYLLCSLYVIHKVGGLHGIGIPSDADDLEIILHTVTYSETRKLCFFLFCVFSSIHSVLLPLPLLYAEQGLCNCPASVCLRVHLSQNSLHGAAAGLLLWAQRAGYIDRLLHGRRSAARHSAANAGYASLSANAGS